MNVPDKPVKKKYFKIFKKYLKKFGLTIAEWHSLVIGVSGGILGGAPLAAAMWGLVTSGKKLSGHLKDVKKEFGYFISSFAFVEVLEWVLLTI